MVNLLTTVTRKYTDNKQGGERCIESFQSNTYDPEVSLMISISLLLIKQTSRVFENTSSPGDGELFCSHKQCHSVGSLDVQLKITNILFIIQID